MTPTPDLKAAALAAGGLQWEYTGRQYGDEGGAYESISDSSGGEIIGEFGPSADETKFIALANPATILALIERLQVAEDAAKDAERLDFVLANDAFMYETPTDAGTTAYQLWNQDEDENYHVLCGEESFYPTKRAAIDAAIAARRLTP